MNDAPPPSELRALLRRQYGAALAMLRSAVAACPEAAWTAVGDGSARPSDPPRPVLPPPYARDDVLAYAAGLEGRLENCLAALDLTAATSGFSWYPVSELEHQLISLRHLQHHAAQLIARGREAGGDPGGWRAAPA